MGNGCGGNEPCPNCGRKRCGEDNVMPCPSAREAFNILVDAADGTPVDAERKRLSIMVLDRTIGRRVR